MALTTTTEAYLDSYPGRRTGGTHRRLLRALLHASEGRDVLFVVGSHQRAIDLFRSAVHATTDVTDMRLHRSAEEVSIGYPGEGGVVRFVTREQERRAREGARWDVTIADI